MHIKSAAHSIELFVAPGTLCDALRDTLFVVRPRLQHGKLDLALGTVDERLLDVLVLLHVGDQILGKVGPEAAGDALGAAS